jgi:hypothetical protein
VGIAGRRGYVRGCGPVLECDGGGLLIRRGIRSTLHSGCLDYGSEADHPVLGGPPCRLLARLDTDRGRLIGGKLRFPGCGLRSCSGNRSDYVDFFSRPVRR